VKNRRLERSEVGKTIKVAKVGKVVKPVKIINNNLIILYIKII